MALVAAYVLLIQALFGAFAIGASAGPLIDQPGSAVLCAPLGAEPAPDGTPLAPGHHLPDCCLTGCMMFGAAILPPLSAGGIFVPAKIDAAPARPAAIALSVPPRRGTPIHPRAPPATA
ncbi:MAG: hypothetical protein J0H11_18045 [Rhizobiales bacterium]|nr:hypothetical protein [Hyphomicrobiales bacterium]